MLQVEESPPLTPEQLRMLRESLERMRAVMSERLAREERVARQAEPLMEPGEMAELTREQSDAADFLAHDHALLRDIEHALGKFETGRYGSSEVSGRPISYRRLQAVPWARTDTDE